ncbi:DUF305 domain-containing protein [Nocardioides lacusdianchii]|uniref:DUF305 domain-containing protein n=1 Tax=Nocardioides lacusdianchii TaxID=2783664 RepID=UPI001CCC25D5|nr:DUF305 domain-containing protein [Nocardioides lacusdianchii]
MGRMWSGVVAAVAVLALVVAAVALLRDDDGSMPHRDARAWSMGGGMGHDTWSTDDEAGFLREMVAHHREAIETAGELARSERPAMRALGARIVSSQTAQVEQMGAWLDEWYADDPVDTAYEPMMRDLSGLSDDRLDRTFLEDMVGHHMAAVMMSQRLLVHGAAENDEVADLARTIRTEQVREIRWMSERLSTWFGVSAAHGRMMGCPGLA